MDGDGLIGELKRRGVLKTAAWYCGLAFGALQLVDVVDDPLGLPAWTLRATIIALVLGFPVLLALSWRYDLTRFGVVTTPDVVDSEPMAVGNLADPWLWIGLGAGLLLGFGVVQGWRSYTDPGLIPTSALETFNRANRDFTAAQQARDPAIRRDSAHEAVDLFEQVLDDAPKWPRAWTRLAAAHELLADAPGEDFLEHRDAARDALDEASALAPQDAEVQTDRARFLIELDGDPTGAVAILRPLVERDPRNETAEGLLAAALAALGAWTECEALGRRWMAAMPDSPDAAAALAGALVAQAKYREADQVYNRAATLARTPSLAIALERALIPLHERGDLDAFSAALAAQQERFAGRWRWTRARVAAALALGDVVSAQKLLVVEPSDEWPIGERDYLMALVARTAGDEAAFRAAATRALALLEKASGIELRRRTLADRLTARAHLHGLLGEPGRGQPLLTNAESLIRADAASPSIVALRHALALAYDACGDRRRGDEHRAWLAAHPTPLSSARTLDLIPGIAP